MGQSESNASYGFAQLRGIVRPASGFTAVILGVAVFDVLVSLALSVVLPDSYYLKHYLYDSFEETTGEFLAGEAQLLPDAKTGWVNRPGQTVAGSVFEEDGTRRSARYEQNEAGDMRTVLFLGSSLIHGGFGVFDEETIASYLAMTGVRSVNHGTMMYSVDQSLLFLQNHVDAPPDAIVVGVEDNVMAMDNMFVPFREREQENMPFLKPRLRIADEEILVAQPELARQGSIESMVNYLDTLRAFDGSYDAYVRFKRLGLLPVSRSILYFWNRVAVVLPDRADYERRLQLQKIALLEMQNVALAADARLIVVRFSTPRSQKRRLLNIFVDDPRNSHESEIRSLGLPVIDVQSLLRSSGQPMDQMYAEDGLHLTALANEQVADAIKLELGGGSQQDQETALSDPGLLSVDLVRD